jgi:5-methylcytosine-specific restriction endonuclease McrA
VATPETEERRLAIGREGTAKHLERIVRGWRRLDRIAEAKEATRRHRARVLRVYHDEDGMVVIRARLEPESGAVVKQASEAARGVVDRRREAKRRRDGLIETLADGFEDAPTVEQQNADALVMLAESALHHGIDPGTPGERYQVVVHVDAEVLANADAPGQSVIENGPSVSGETSQRLACDASRVVMRHDTDGRITEVGARTRTIPPALRRALQHRDRGCRFPGCWVSLGQGHHIRHANGGPTTLSNLVVLCRRHHRAVHEEGYRVERLSDGDLRFRRPDGETVPEAPPPPPVPADAMGTLQQSNEARGITINARTVDAGLDRRAAGCCVCDQRVASGGDGAARADQLRAAIP